MTELEKYEMVNKCETVKELSDVIIKISNGIEIDGRLKKFDAERMSKNVDLVVNYDYPPNLLTRMYGIRQQALYLKYYKL